MARLAPFRGTYYDDKLVAPDDVISPPYDVVSPAEREVLAARSPYNAIHVELPKAPAGSLVDPYEHAARLFSDWHALGAVALGAEPGLSIYRMTYADDEGRPRSTTGVLGALALDPDHGGDVLPHEETIPKDRSDRLSLLRATRANLSPIWGLSLAKGLASTCESALAGRKAWRASDDEGVVHERLVVSEPDAVARICALVASTPVLIADGHHRYETACAYLDEVPTQPGADSILAFVTELDAAELSVGAIHRLVRGEGGAFVEGLERWFEIREAPADASELPAAMRSSGALGLVTDGAAFVLLPRSELKRLAGSDLDSSLVAAALADLGAGEVAYEPSMAEVFRAVRAGDAVAGMLLRPVPIGQIAATAHSRRRMPPKSTYFHPKPRTGMAFRELDAG